MQPASSDRSNSDMYCPCTHVQQVLFSDNLLESTTVTHTDLVCILNIRIVFFMMLDELFDTVPAFIKVGKLAQGGR